MNENNSKSPIIKEIPFSNSMKNYFEIIEIFLYLSFMIWFFLMYLPKYAVDVMTVNYFSIDTALHVDSSLKTGLFSASGWRGYGLGYYKTALLLDFFLPNSHLGHISDYSLRYSNYRFFSFIALNCFSLLIMFYSYISVFIDSQYFKWKTIKKIILSVCLFILLTSSNVWKYYMTIAYPDILMVSILGIIFSMTMLRELAIGKILLLAFLTGYAISVKQPALLFVGPFFLLNFNKIKKSVFSFGIVILVSYLFFSYPLDLENIYFITEIIMGNNTKFNAFRIPFSVEWMEHFLKSFFNLYPPIFLTLGILSFSFVKFKDNFEKQDLTKVVVLISVILVYLISHPLKINIAHYPMLVFPLVLFLMFFLAHALRSYIHRFVSFEKISNHPMNLIIIFFVAVMISKFFSPEEMKHVKMMQGCQNERLVIGNLLKSAASKNKNSRLFKTPYTEGFGLNVNSYNNSDILKEHYTNAIFSQLYLDRYKNVKMTNYETDPMAFFYTKIMSNKNTFKIGNASFDLIYEGKHCPVLLYDVKGL